MEYYKLLQLEREPFSNSPDPEYFFQSDQHLGCLQKLELALRLKRGLNVVIGNVGTGKTTLCRQLIRDFAGDDEFETYLILDPAFEHPLAFLQTLHELLCTLPAEETKTEAQLKEAVKQHLFTKGVDQNKTLILIIDEGQKISEPCVEVLRELLNYETNTHKLLQIVIFAQLEFKEIMQAHANFADRINLLHLLAPMSFKDTRRMVLHRIKLSSSGPKPMQLFTLPAMWAIYRASKGYPRKIIHLCHQSILAMIIQNRARAGWALVQSCKKRLAVTADTGRRAYLIPVTALAVAVFAFISLSSGLLTETSEQLQKSLPGNPDVPNISLVASEPALTEAEPMEPASITVPIGRSLPDPEEETRAASPEQLSSHIPAMKNDKPDPLPDVAVTQPESNAGAPDGLKPSSPHPPVFIGQIIIQPGDTLADLAWAVYGTYRNNPLKAVIAANPHIQNPNSITIGEIVRFPTLATHPKSKDCPCFWILLDESPSLPSVMQKISDISQKMVVPLQVIPHWHPDAGMRFFVTIKGYFISEAAADDYSRALPESIMKNGRIISHWPKQTRYYTDPYAGGELVSPIHDVRK